MANDIWSGDGFSSNWFNPFNWGISPIIPGSVPGLDDSVFLDDDVSTSISITGGTARTGSVQITRGDALTVGSTGALFTRNSITLGSLSGSKGVLVVNNGGEIATGTGLDDNVNQLVIGSTSELVLGGFGGAQAFSSGLINANIKLNGGELRFNTTDNVILSSTITGNGGNIVAQGAATVVLASTSNSTTATTTIDSGATLQIGNGAGALGALNGGGAIIDNGSLVFFDPNSVTGLSGVISGAGLLNVILGEIELTNAETYTGATFINPGSRLDLGLGTSATGSLKTSSVFDNGVLAFDNQTAATITYAISGLGQIFNFGAAITLDNSDDSFLGGAFIASGSTINVGNNDHGTIGQGNIINNGTLTFQNTAGLAYLGVISGTGAVNQTVASLTFGGVNTYSGVTTISKGFLTIGTNSRAGSLGTGAVVDNGGLILNNLSAPTVANAISGTGDLFLSGTKLVRLTGANSYNQTIISSGSLAIGADDASGSLGTGAVTDNGNLDFSRSDATTVANNISGSGAVDQFFGITTLTGTNTYTGVTTVNSGTLKGGAANAISIASKSVTVDSGATLDLDGFDETLNNLSGAGTIDNSGQAAATLTVVTTIDGTFSGLIENTGGALTIVVNNAGGVLTLTGENTYSGGTQLISGKLIVGAGGGGSLGTGPVTDNGQLVFDTFDSASSGISGTGSVTIDKSMTFNGANSYTGSTTVASNVVLTIADGGSLGNGGAVSFGNGGANASSGGLLFERTGTLTVNNSIFGDGGLVQNDATGTTILAGAGAYTGGTFVLAGTLQGGANDAFSADSGFFSIASGAFLDLGGFNQTVSDLQGAGTINNSGSGAATLTITDNGANLFISGLIENTGGALSLVKSGGNTEFLAHTNSYTGGTTVNNGVLSAQAVNAFGADSIVTVAASGFLNLDGFDQTIASLNGAGTVENRFTANAAMLTISDTSLSQFGHDIFSGVITGANLSVTTGANTSIVFLGDNTYGGTTTINGELLIGDVTQSGTLGTGAVIDNGVLRLLRNDTSFTLANAISGTGSLSAELGDDILTGDNTYSGGTVIRSISLQVGHGGTAGSLGTGAVDDQTSLIFDLAAGDDEYIFGNAISGPGSVSFTNNGTYGLTGSNSYGLTTVGASAVLAIGNKGTTGSLGSGAVTDNGVIEFFRADAMTVANAIGGSGMVVQGFSGTTTLTGANTYSGFTRVDDGVLMAGSDNAFGTQTVFVNGSGTLDLGGFSENEAVVSSGKLTSSKGVGTLTGALTNNNLLSAAGGGIIMTQAVVGSGRASISAGGVLTFRSAFNQNVAFAGPGSLTLAKSKSYTATLSGFAPGDVLDLLDVSANGATLGAAGALTLTQNGATVETLHLGGSFAGDVFVTTALSAGTELLVIPSQLTVAEYLQAPTYYDRIPAGFAITDSAPNIVSALNALNADAHLTKLTLSSGAATISGQTIKAPALVETGATTTLTIGANLVYTGAFAQGAGATISVSNAAGLTLKTATLAGATSGAGGLTLAGGTSTIANTATLSTARWTVSGASTNVNVAGNFIIYGGVFNLGAGANLSIAAKDTLRLNGTSNISGHISGAGTLSIGGGAATLIAGATVTTLAWTLAAGGGTAVQENLTYAGAFSQAAVPALAVGTGDTFTLAGPASLSGLVRGAGTLTLSGAATVAGGALFNILNWSVTGGVTTIAKNFFYAGNFNVSGATLTLTGASAALTLQGKSAFAGATINGAGAFNSAGLSGAVSVAGLTLGGAVSWTNVRAVTEKGGKLTLGDASGLTAKFSNTRSATFNLQDDSGIALGGKASIANAGVIEKTGSAGGVSLIAPDVVNTGSIQAAAGTLELAGAISGVGSMQARAGRTLKLDGAVAATQSLSFGPGGGEVFLNDLVGGGKQLFGGVLRGWAAGDVLDVGTAFNGAPLYNFQENNGHTGGTLTVSGNGASASIAFGGLNGATLTKANFTESLDSTGATVFSYHT